MAAAQVRNVDGSVTYAQMARIARTFCEIAGVEMPSKRGEASELIQTLMAQRDAIAQTATEVPF